MATGLIWDDSCSGSDCRTCSLANIKRLPFPKKSDLRADRPLFRIHSDICGPLPNSYGSFRYFILFIDCYSRFTSIYFLHKKSEALDRFIEYKKAVETYLGEKIAVLRIDNASELVRGPFELYTKKNGITYEKITPDASPQNGVAERANWTVASMTRSMLIDGDMPDFFWPLAAQAAIHIKNRVPHAAISEDKTPYELWFGRKPDLSHLRPFGCHVTVRKPDTDTLGKLEPRGEPGRFVGYPRDASGYLIWFPNAKAVRVRRDIKFHGMPTVTTSARETHPLWDDIPMTLEHRL